MCCVYDHRKCACIILYGMCRALYMMNLTQQARYLASNSGGSWFNSAFSYQVSSRRRKGGRSADIAAAKAAAQPTNMVAFFKTGVFGAHPTVVHNRVLCTRSLLSSWLQAMLSCRLPSGHFVF